MCVKGGGGGGRGVKLSFCVIPVQPVRVVVAASVLLAKAHVYELLSNLQDAVEKLVTHTMYLCFFIFLYYCMYVLLNNCCLTMANNLIFRIESRI